MSGTRRVKVTATGHVAGYHPDATPGPRPAGYVLAVDGVPAGATLAAVCVRGNRYRVAWHDLLRPGAVVLT